MFAPLIRLLDELEYTPKPTFIPFGGRRSAGDARRAVYKRFRCYRTYEREAIPLFPFEEVPQGL
jgi:hypothetical protein